MELHEALFSIGLLIVVAKLLEGIFKRFGLNSIIAYATTGVILGPMTGLVETGTEVELILSIGIFIFFFLIGLEELDIRGFLSAIRGRLFLASVLSVTISLLVSLAVTTDTFFDLGLDLDFTQALGLAGVLSLSSLGVAAKVLIDEGRLKEPVGVQIFTAVIIAELIALFVVGFAISEHFYAGGQGHTLDLLSVSTIIAQIIGFTIATWFVSTKVLPKVIVLLHHFLQVPPTLFRFALEGIKVQDILDRSRSHPGHSLTVKAFAETWLLPGQHDYVVVEQRKLAGIVSLSMLRYLPRSEWESTTLGRVLRQNTPHAYSDELVEDALQRMTENSLTVIPVEDKESGEFIGSVSSNEVLEMVALTAKGHEI